MATIESSNETAFKNDNISTNVGQKQLETVFSLPFVAQLATNDNRKHCFKRFFFICVRRLLRAFSIAAYPLREWV